MRVCVYTLGCRLNQCESEAICDSFLKESFEVVKEDDNADIYIVNTCTVTSKAEQKARRMIRLFSKRSEAVIVTGCYAELNEKEIRALSDNIVVFTLEKKASLLKLAKHIKASLISNISLFEAVSSFSEFETNPFNYNATSFSYHSRAYLKIQEGCDNECSYCRVHIARGKSQFLEGDEVIKRAIELEKAGFNEIVLTGVNLTMYDHEGSGLGGLLLRMLPLLKKTTRVRLSSMEPDHIDSKLIEALKDKRMHPHFHIPIQTASNKVLKRVNRKYDSSHLDWVIKSLREVKDDPFIACDIITGLPSEDDDDFLTTKEFLIEKGFASIHVFPFSPRPNTSLEKANDRVSERVRDERAQVLRELSESLHDEYTLRQIGKECEVLVESRKNGKLYGTTGNYLKVEIVSSKPFVKKGDILTGRLVKKGVFEANEC